MFRKCLFVINGLGLGNSTRCYAIIEQLRLRRPDLEIHVLTSGNGLEFFANKAEVASVTEIENFFYSEKDHQISAWRTFLALGHLAKKAIIKQRQFDEALSRLKPGVVIVDSEYTVRSARRQGIPVLALNNSDVIVSEYFRRKNKPLSIAGQFWLVEFMDYLFHRFCVDLVISPAPTRLPARHKKIKRVGLIIRKVVRRRIPDARPFSLPQSQNHLLCMLSGSSLGTRKNLDFSGLPYQVKVVGRPGESNEQVCYCGRLMDNTEHLLDSDLWIINGGFSAVSEALALNKPTLVIPVPKHAEQYINAMLLQDLGRGSSVSEQTVTDVLEETWQTNAWPAFKPHQANLTLDGAEEAAIIILSYL